MPNNASINVIGNLIKDPTHNTVNGQTVVSFTVAVNTTTKKKDGDGYETNFYNVSIWGKAGEYLLTQLQKGTQVYVVGDLVLQTYKGKSGEERMSPQIKATKVDPLKRMKAAPSRDNDDELPV